MEKTILLVGGAELPAVREAVQRRGYKIVAVNFPEAIERLEADPSIVHAEGLDFGKSMQSVHRIVELHKKYQFETIVPISEFGLLTAAIASRQLGMPFTPFETVMNTRDKLRMRRVLEAKGLSQVRFRSCTTVDEVQAFLAEVGGPIIVKPLMGTASDGVSRVDRPDQVEAALRISNESRSFSAAICEEYIDGPEVSVEAYLIDGEFIPVAITDKLTDERFLEMGHSQPTRFSPAIQQQIFDATRDVVVALGITRGVTHTEMRITPRGPRLIETHTRMGGDFIHVLTRTSTGVDLTDLLVACALGEVPTARPTDTGAAAAIRFVTGPAGIVADVDLPQLEDGLLEVRAYVKPGDETTGYSSSLDRFGHVIATGATRAAADERAEEAIARFRVTLDPIQAIAV